MSIKMSLVECGHQIVKHIQSSFNKIRPVVPEQKANTYIYPINYNDNNPSGFGVVCLLQLHILVIYLSGGTSKISPVQTHCPGDNLREMISK